MASRSEPHYFAPESRRGVLTEHDYLRLFEGCREGQRLGEKSVWYLYYPGTAHRIQNFCPDAKIIIMLRDPVDMLYSLHGQLYYSQAENVGDFSRALDLEAERKKGNRIPPGCPDAPMLFYREVAKYAPQVERYFDAFGRVNVHVIVFDDFVKDTAKTYAQALRFLEVDDSFAPPFDVHNPRTRPRIPGLMYWRHNYPAFFRTFGKAVLPSARLRHGLMNVLEHLNTKRDERKPIEAGLRQALDGEFRPDVERLSRLLDRDLMHWVEP